MMTWSAWPDDQRAATEVPRNSGHPPRAGRGDDNATGATLVACSPPPLPRNTRSRNDAITRISTALAHAARPPVRALAIAQRSGPPI